MPAAEPAPGTSQIQEGANAAESHLHPLPTQTVGSVWHLLDVTLNVCAAISPICKMEIDNASLLHRGIEDNKWGTVMGSIQVGRYSWGENISECTGVSHIAFLYTCSSYLY